MFLIHEALTAIWITSLFNSQRIGYNVEKYKRLFGDKECGCCPKDIYLEIPLLDDLGLRNVYPGKSNLVYGLSLIELIKDSFNLMYTDTTTYFYNFYKPVLIDFMTYADQVMREYRAQYASPPNPTPEALMWNGGDGNLSKSGPAYESNKEFMTFQKKYIGNVTDSFLEEFEDAAYSVYSAGYPTEIYHRLKTVKNHYDVDGRVMTTLGNNILMAVCDNFLIALRRALGVRYNNIKDRASALAFEYSFIHGILDFNNFYFNFFEKLRALIWLKKVLTRILGEFPFFMDKKLSKFAEELSKYYIYWDIEDTGGSNVNLGIINIWSYRKESDKIRKNIFNALTYSRNVLSTEYRVRIRHIRYLITEAMIPQTDFYIKTSPSFRRKKKPKEETTNLESNNPQTTPNELSNSDFWNSIHNNSDGGNQSNNPNNNSNQGNS